MPHQDNLELLVNEHGGTVTLSDDGDFLEINLSSKPIPPTLLSAICTQTRLRSIRFVGTALSSDDLQAIGRVKTIEKVFFENVSGLTDKHLEGLERLPSLKMIGISGSRVGDHSVEIISRHSKLEHLSLQYTQITDNAVLPLIHLKYLTSLSLAFSSNISDGSMETISQIPNVRVLILSGTSVTDKGVRPLAGMQQLTKLTLEQTKVTPEGIDRLQKRLPNTVILPTRQFQGNGNPDDPIH